jgi:hypothetical protein
MFTTKNNQKYSNLLSLLYSTSVFNATMYIATPGAVCSKDLYFHRIMCGNPDFAHGLLQLFELPRMCMTPDLGSAAPT